MILILLLIVRSLANGHACAVAVVVKPELALNNFDFFFVQRNIKSYKNKWNTNNNNDNDDLNTIYYDIHSKLSLIIDILH